MRSRKLLAVLLCAAQLTSGCAFFSKETQTAAVDPEVGAQEVEPIAKLRLTEFIIGVGDEIEISVYRHDALEQTTTVGLSGKIMFPLVGDVQAAGKSVFALRDEITEKLSRFLVKPVVTVQLGTIKSRRTMVLGEVKAPGSFVLDTELSVLQALVKAGGATDDANLSRVLLVRRGPGNKKTEIYLDVKKALTGKDYAADMALMNGDILYVPLRGIANISRYASYLGEILSPIVSLEGGIVLAPLVRDVFTGDGGDSSVTIPTQ